MLGICKMPYFQVIKTLLTTSTDNPADYRPSACEGDNWSEESSVPVITRWLWSGNRTFLEVVTKVVTCWIVAFLHSVIALHIGKLNVSYRLCDQPVVQPWE